VTAIKICGITRLEDALFAARCGVDALGFIFYPRSPRNIAPEEAKRIIDGLSEAMTDNPSCGQTVFSASGRMTTVGVFVNEDMGIVNEISSFCNLDLIQLHGNEPPSYCDRFPAERVIKAFALQTDADLERIRDYRVRAILVDTHDPVRYGGTGRIANWELAVKARGGCPLILSGGLHSGNLCDALTAVRPDAVDISSGAEISPGVKDHEKVKAVIDLVHQGQ